MLTYPIFFYFYLITLQKFYMVGSNKSRTLWKVLKIDRLEPSELSVREDPTTYSESECYELLKRVHEGNISTGGLKFVTKCYGIAGTCRFVKFLGPYYMLLVTRRRKIGTICGHTIYTVSKSEMVPLPTSAVQSSFAYSKDENRSSVILLLHTLSVHKKDRNFEATRLHFRNLVKRYGNPIIILNLIKSREKKPRESLLRAEFANAIDFINKDLPEEKRLKFLHWDIQKHTRRKGSNVLELLGKVFILFCCLENNVVYLQLGVIGIIRDDPGKNLCYIAHKN
ncbi:hypothetical protein BHM03_00017305 [Ensete ventricosum]|nr:hypothetical protein BHM03_00017305 [Ensete ventricosum]